MLQSASEPTHRPPPETCNLDCGLVVPMPTFPTLLELSTNRLSTVWSARYRITTTPEPPLPPLPPAAYVPPPPPPVLAVPLVPLPSCPAPPPPWPPVPSIPPPPPPPTHPLTPMPVPKKEEKSTPPP